MTSTAQRPSFRGLLAYPITPLDDAGHVDHAMLREIVARAVGAGVDGVTVLASSGGGTSFDRAERAAVARTAVEAGLEAEGSAGDAVPGVPVYVAVSAASTSEVVQLAADARAAGAAGLVLTPFSYVPLVDDEVIALFESVAAETGLPICFYNKPMQTGYDVTPAVLAHLAETAGLTAVKEPVIGSVPLAVRLASIRRAVGTGSGDGSAHESAHGDRFSVGLSGDVGMLQTLEVADAWHTGLAGLLPTEYVEVRRATAAGAPEDAGVEWDWLLTVAVQLTTMRPVAALHALAAALGYPTAPPRGPVLPAPPDAVARLREIVAARPAR